MSQPNQNIVDLLTESALTGGLSDIANAIGKFKLNGGALTVINGVFTLPYDGDAPQNAPFTATIMCALKGTKQTGLSYTVSYSNGVATFTLSGTPDGVYTQSVAAVIMLGDYAVPITITGLPVMYAPFIEQPSPLAAQVLEWDYTAANTVDFSPYVYPKNVSPQVDYGDGYNYAIDVYVSRNDDTIGGMVFIGGYELTQDNNFTFTIPANTFTSGNNYMFGIKSTSALLSDSPYGDSNAEIAIYEQGAE